MFYRRPPNRVKSNAPKPILKKHYRIERRLRKNKEIIGVHFYFSALNLAQNWLSDKYCMYVLRL
jgi:hypothetical protein